MPKKADKVIQYLKDQLAKAKPRGHRTPYVFPVANVTEIRAAETKLGFELPPLLKRIYLEIGNGGSHLGPGYGILGLPGGYDNHGGWNIVKSSLEMAAAYPWWNRTIVICDRGCCMLSCIDCSDDDFTVYRWNGNEFDKTTDLEDPSDELWGVEADSLEDWLMTTNRSQ
jgi:hypothetical protein